MKYVFLLFFSLSAFALPIANTDLHGILYASDNSTASQSLNNAVKVCSQVIPLDYATHFSITATTISSNTVAGNFYLEATNDNSIWVSVTSQAVAGDDNFLFNITNSGYLSARLCYAGTAVAGTYSAKYTRKFFRN